MAIHDSTSSRRIRPLGQTTDAAVDAVDRAILRATGDARSLSWGLSSTAAPFLPDPPEDVVTSVSVMLPAG